MKTKIKYLQPDIEKIKTLGNALNCHKIFATLLINRNINTIEQARSFLNPDLNRLKDPFLLKDMDKAVERIWLAIQNNEKILIFGDFDADGVTSTSLLSDFFTHVNADITWYIPHRIKEGYSIQKSHISMSADMDIDLIITVDCGSSSNDAIIEANLEDIDVIITDHHEIQEELPKALAVVNPKRKDCTAGLEYLAGVGVAFYLVIALRQFLRNNDFWEDLSEPNLLDYSDLVAIGTIGDMVPLINENRILCKAGLKKMQNGTRPGVKAISEVSKINFKHIDSDDLSFKIVPRINAAGRMSHARICVNQLTSPMLSGAMEIASLLDQLNQKRQQVEKVIIIDIEKRIKNNPRLLENKAFVFWDDNWNPSVLGIVASKISRQYARPTIILSTSMEPSMGSGRSIENINILEAIGECEHLVEKFGGHSMACGVTIKKENIIDFQNKFTDFIAQTYTDEDFIKTLPIDYILDFEDITYELAKEIDQLRPFGVKNPEPVFMCKDIKVVSSFIIGTNHRKMTLGSSKNSSNHKVDAFKFNLSSLENLPQYYEEVVFKLKINKYTMNSAQIILEEL